MDDATFPGKAPVKRRDPEKTKARIIEAAKQLFAERGYAQTGLRDIAKLADVSSALPVRYFESKAGLFEAALLSALNLQAVLNVDKDNFGKTLVKAVLDPDQPITIPAMISLAIGDDESAVIAKRFAEEYMIKPIALWLGPPNGYARANLLMTISTGFVIYNRHILIEGSAASKKAVAVWLENTLQGIVDGTDEAIAAFQPQP